MNVSQIVFTFQYGSTFINKLIRDLLIEQNLHSNMVLLLLQT